MWIHSVTHRLRAADAEWGAARAPRINTREVTGQCQCLR